MKVIKKTLIEKTPTTYNLHVKENHNYVASGVVVSNCHGIKADALSSMLTSVMARIPIRWAVTGTIPKEEADRRSLQVAIGNVTGTIRASDLQEKGVLANCHVHIKQLIDYKEFKNYQDELKYLLGDVDRLTQMSKMILEISKTGNTLVLVDRVSPGQAIADSIPGAVFLSGASKSTDRKEQYDSHAVVDGAITVCTYGIAAVGLNIPRIFNLILIEPGKSFVRVIQSIGRGLRKAGDKDAVEIFDITSNCKFAKRHLTTRKKYYTEAGYPYTIDKIEWK